MTGAVITAGVIVGLLGLVLFKQWLAYQRVLRGRDQVWNGAGHARPGVERQDREPLRDVFR